MAFVALFALSGFVLAQSVRSEESAPPPVTPECAATMSANPHLTWWRKARFGMFIHWGVYSVPARGEWILFTERIDVREYKKFADGFTAARFDPAAWARAAKEAGMGYMVLTARHHDGFSLWDSPSSFEHFTSVRSAAKRDLVAEFVEAVRTAGLRVGFYYSPLDWRFPGFFFPEMYRENAEALRDQTYAQVRELLTRYGKIDVLWYDGGGDDWLGFGGLEWNVGEGWHTRDKKWPQTKRYAGKPLWEPEKLQAMVRELQPGILTNDRVGNPGEYADFLSREWSVGAFDNTIPWEKCATITGAWGYREGWNPRPLKDLLSELSHTVCRDGNFLLNVGPKPDGTLSEGETTRLREIGEWMKVNGEAIHDTRGGPLRPTEEYGTTHRGKTVYVHIWKWPSNGRIALPLAGCKPVSSVTLSGDATQAAPIGDGVLIERMKIAEGAPLTIVSLVLDSLPTEP